MARLNQTYIIWALGPRTNANIMQHTDRGGGYVGECSHSNTVCKQNNLLSKLSMITVGLVLVYTQAL